MTRTREIAPSGGASAAKSASALREGARIGGLAAAAVALAFAAADWVVVGDPLFTVSRLGAGIATVLGIGAVSKAGAAAGYALLHFAAFVITGVAASGVARLARKEPTVLAGALLALAVIEVGFNGLVVLLRESTFTGALTALQLAAGNLLGAVVIGTSLWRAHPELRCELASAVGATDEEARAVSWRTDERGAHVRTCRTRAADGAARNTLVPFEITGGAPRPAPT